MAHGHGLPGPSLVRAAGLAATLAGVGLSVIGFSTRNAPGPEAWLALDHWSRAGLCLIAAGFCLAAHARLPAQPMRARMLAGWAAFLLDALLAISLLDEDGLVTLMMATPAAALATLAAVGATWDPANP